MFLLKYIFNWFKDFDNWFFNLILLIVTNFYDWVEKEIKSEFFRSCFINVILTITAERLSYWLKLYLYLSLLFYLLLLLMVIFGLAYPNSPFLILLSYYVPFVRNFIFPLRLLWRLFYLIISIICKFFYRSFREIKKLFKQRMTKASGDRDDDYKNR